MVHKAKKKEDFLEKLKKVKVVKELIEETEKNKKWINEKFQRLPMMLQVALASPKDSMFLSEVYPFEPKGERKVEKIRYGLVAVHKNSVYIGNLRPVGKDKAEIRMRKVFP